LARLASLENRSDSKFWKKKNRFC